MKTYTPAELADILERHKHWLNEDCDGWSAMRADLVGADLSHTYLSYKNLSHSDLRGANLSYADLSYADLSYADLRGSLLRGAYLSHANLSYADLRGSHLSHALLSHAQLIATDLRGAHLGCSDLRHASLFNADLRGAHLVGADLRDAVDQPHVFMTCPDTGSFVGWKKAQGYIVKLLIPEDARRSSSTTRKCRCDKAEVLEIQNPDGSPADIDEVCGDYARLKPKPFIYKVGETVTEPDFCEDRFAEYAPGIHFFINRQEAVDY